MQKLSTESGGSAFAAVKVNDLKEVYDRIAIELKNQYFLGYISNVRTEDPWRRIQVHSDRSGVQMRARTGYYAANN